ncbi:tail protein X [Brevibacillus parabrevis]|uniref:Membrane protein n=1 Tax=Brevibacillus parabrevis TaxID=54914 RepID=A0A4Y3PWV4_BREPA|nr:tail protein X [Brevibacillus parabrevis]RNB94439.1 phage tail protein [Brevibacillus parabrevis]GEB35311.1 membrane protein [Brevibacillus parabrevis]
MKLYHTIQGDIWDLIAFKALGSEEHMAALIEANPAHRETVIFSAGVQLTIPDVVTVDTPDTLPPWKRGESG